MRPTYTNPLYPASLPDPYVLKHAGEYWAYGSEKSCDGRYFKILHSRDLVHWQEVGGALDEQPGGHTCYWAPEVTCWGSRFYLYYSLGNETRMTIRVASSAAPGGPFEDSGRSLTGEPFAIDAHVFEDDDGTRYLFYASDFLDHPRTGTGTVVDHLLDPFTLAGSPHPVTRARYDWQIFDPQRKEKGGLRWHTLEGPFVLKHKGRYYQMFSGGNWQNTSYGVAYATSPSLDTQEEWEQACDGVNRLPILRSLPEQGIVGPGHNSAVRGPDNRQWFCVYHRWAPTAAGPARLMAADRLEFIGERLTVLGPSNTPQPAPIPPTCSFFMPAQVDSAGLPPGWQADSGDWRQVQGAAVQTSTGGLAEATWALPAASFLLEVSLAPSPIPNPATAVGATPLAGCGLHLEDGSGEHITIMLRPDQQSLAIDSTQEQAVFRLRYAIEAGAQYMLRLDANHLALTISLDGSAVCWQDCLAAPLTRLSLRTEWLGAAFSAFQWTAGWEDRFDLPGCDLTALGWVEPSNTGAWKQQHNQLCANPHPSQPAMVYKPLPAGDYELLLNARLEAQAAPGAGYGFGPLISADGQPLFNLVRREAGWFLAAPASGQADLPLPPAFDPSQMQQFRLHSLDGQLSVVWEAHLLGNLSHPPAGTLLGLSARQACAWFDLVRVTMLPGLNKFGGETHDPA